MSAMKGFCADCNEKGQHGVTYAIALGELILNPVFHHLRKWLPATDTLQLAAIQGALRLGLAEAIDTPDDKTLLLDVVLWEEAKLRNIHMQEIRLFGSVSNTFIATLPSGRTIEFENIPIEKAMAGVSWINNKPLLKKRLAAAGFPVPKGKAVMTLRGAQIFFNTLTPPVIVKPAIGSASRHTTIHIQNVAGLEKAFISAKEISPLVIIEEEMSGGVYRPTLVNGVLAATLRRDQAHVIGNGVHTVSELVAIENKNPKRRGPYFSQIALKDEALAELLRQGLTPASVPTLGSKVQLHQKINWSLGGTTADVTNDVHPDNKKLFEDVAKLLKAPLVGIDFIIDDISRSWKEQPRCGIIECNDMPYFDNHHLPFEGEPHNVAGKVWDLVAS